MTQLSAPPANSNVTFTSKGSAGGSYSAATSPVTSLQSSTTTFRQKYANNLRQVFWRKPGMQNDGTQSQLPQSVLTTDFNLHQEPSTTEKLAVLEHIINDLEGQRTEEQFLAQPTASLQVTSSRASQDSLDQPLATGLATGMMGLPQDQTFQHPPATARKELEGGSVPAIEQTASLQLVEQEKSPELSPEVEKYLQEVHKEKDQAPQEIVLADDATNLPSDNQFVSEPVLVLPITTEIEKKGKRKSPVFSIRWLVEWSQKIIKMFAGKVIYLQAERYNQN